MSNNERSLPATDPTFYAPLLEVTQQLNPEFHQFVLDNWNELVSDIVTTALYEDLSNAGDEYNSSQIPGLVASIVLWFDWEKCKIFLRVFAKLVHFFGYNLSLLALFIEASLLVTEISLTFRKEGRTSLKTKLKNSAPKILQLWLQLAGGKHGTNLITVEQITAACIPVIEKMFG